MSDNEFRQPISVDFAPRGSLCAWCGKPAELQLTTPGDKYHDEVRFFCQACGKEFARTVADSLSRVITMDAINTYA